MLLFFSTIADFILSCIMAKSGYIIYLLVATNMVSPVHSVPTYQLGDAP